MSLTPTESPASSSSGIKMASSSSRAPTIVEVDLGNRSYPIYIGSGLLDQPDLLQRYSSRAISLFYPVHC